MYSLPMHSHTHTHTLSLSLSDLQWLQELLNESGCIREYYYSSSINLKAVMTLLGSDPSVAIRFKALDILQVKCGLITIMHVITIQ